MGKKVLTILLVLGLPHGYELRETLILVTGHRSISSLLQGEVQFKMGVQMLLQCLITHESHATYVAVKLNAFEDFNLGKIGRSEQKKG